MANEQDSFLVSDVAGLVLILYVVLENMLRLVLFLWQYLECG